jgi:hypothetical protein
VAAGAQLVREPLDEAVDLVMLLPGPGCYLGYRVRHGGTNYSTRRTIRNLGRAGLDRLAAPSVAVITAR